MSAVRVLISGRVQGVGYRAWTAAMARKLKLNGWVRNLKDGSVEAVFSGDSIAIEQMLAKCWKGPMLAKVAKIDQFVCDENPKEFFQKPTA
jgi:acylphosphatase